MMKRREKIVFLKIVVERRIFSEEKERGLLENDVWRIMNY